VLLDPRVQETLWNQHSDVNQTSSANPSLKRALMKLGDVKVAVRGDETAFG
jgi:hypothetical protein